jgi:hypothetical protein
MTVMTETPQITEKQVKFINDLAAQRETKGLSAKAQMLIHTVCTKNIDELHVSRTMASSLIELLLSVKPNPALVSDEKAMKAKIFADLQALLKTLPLSRYALPRKDGTGWDFFEITEAKQSKTRFVNQLLGSPSSWNHKFMPNTLALSAARAIARAPKESAVAYATQHGRCAVCNAHLSDPESITIGLGPICRKRFPSGISSME